MPDLRERLQRNALGMQSWEIEFLITSHGTVGLEFLYQTLIFLQIIWSLKGSM